MIEKYVLEIKARDKTISKRDEDDWKSKKTLDASLCPNNSYHCIFCLQLDVFEKHGLTWWSLVIKVKIMWMQANLRNNHDCFFVKLNIIMYVM